MQPKKYAYLIMCHGNYNILCSLVKLLDDRKNDIYIHVDKKVKDFDFESLKDSCKESKVYFTKKRFNVKWGAASQVKNEMQLFEMASKGKYAYYHLISGVDLPLKTQAEFNDYFKDNNLVYIHFTDKPTKWDYQRLAWFHYPKKWNVRITARLNHLQEILKTDRFKKGYNWCSITHDAVRLLIANKKFIRRMCAYSVCADECYKQILLFDSELKDRIYRGDDGQTDDLREVDWSEGKDSPKVYTMADLERLKQSNKFFARKFDEKVDYEVVKQIEKYVRYRESI